MSSPPRLRVLPPKRPIAKNAHASWLPLRNTVLSTTILVSVFPKPGAVFKSPGLPSGIYSQTTAAPTAKPRPSMPGNGSMRPSHQSRLRAAKPRHPGSGHPLPAGVVGRTLTPGRADSPPASRFATAANAPTGSTPCPRPDHGRPRTR